MTDRLSQQQMPVLLPRHLNAQFKTFLRRMLLHGIAHYRAASKFFRIRLTSATLIGFAVLKQKPRFVSLSPFVMLVTFTFHSRKTPRRRRIYFVGCEPS